MINTNKIKGRMAELQITQKDVANSLGLAQPTVNQKINNIRPMDLNEAEKLSDLLHIDPEDVAVYFLQRKLRSAKFCIEGGEEVTKEELDKKHEEECLNWELLCGMNRCLDRAVDDSLHGLVLSNIAIVLSAIAIILHFVWEQRENLRLWRLWKGLSESRNGNVLVCTTEVQRFQIQMLCNIA